VIFQYYQNNPKTRRRRRRKTRLGGEHTSREFSEKKDRERNYVILFVEFVELK